MNLLLQDLRFAARMLGKSPAFTTIAVITLALGIGANAALFSVIDAVLLKPLPFNDPARLVAVHTIDLKDNRPDEVSYPNFLDWNAQSHAFEGMSVWHVTNFIHTGGPQAEYLTGGVVSANLFSLLGVSPVLGRGFTPDEGNLNSTSLAVVLSHRLWQSRFGSDPNMIGRAIALDGRSFNVVGVMPADFQFPVRGQTVDLWTTIANDMEGKTPMPTQRGTAYLEVIARLKPQVSLEQAQRDMTAIQERLNKQYPENNRHGITINPEINEIVGDMHDPLLVLFGSVGFVLLIACANVANLLLARATSRNKEVAIRTALGATRWNLTRQLLTESVLLSLCGAVLGLVLANWAIRAVLKVAPAGLPRLESVTLDWRVLGFTMLIAVGTGILFGLAPVWQISKRQMSGPLNEGGRSGTEGLHRSRVRGALVVTEVMLALMLLVGAGLLLRSLSQLRKVNPGFAADHVETFAVTLDSRKYSRTQRVEFCSRLLEKIRQLPGVRTASAIFGLPLQSQVGIYSTFEIEGHPTAPSERPQTGYRLIASDYFHTMRISLVKGRDFGPFDTAESKPVAIISETMARRFFPGEDPVGKRFRPGVAIGVEDAPMREIVGVVGDVRSGSLAAASEPEVYVPHAQGPIGYMHIVVRTELRPESLVSAFRNQVAELDRDLPLLDVKTLEEYVDASIAGPRFDTVLLGIFAGLASVLTAIGLYGVISYSVAQRTREMGIRIALGAEPGAILRMVLAQGVRLSLTGVVGGVVASLALTRVLRSMLYGVVATDFLTFATATALLIGVSFFASYIPAYRATRIDPVQALSQE